MISRYVDVATVFLAVCVLLLTPFAEGVSIAGMFLIFFFLLILRIFILSYIKQLNICKKAKEGLQKLHAAGAEVTSTTFLSTQVLYAGAKDKLHYELSSIIVSAVFMILGVLTVDWANLFNNFLHWCNN